MSMKDMDVPPPSYEEATQSNSTHQEAAAADAAAAAALVVDGPGYTFPSPTAYAANEWEAEYGYVAEHQGDYEEELQMDGDDEGERREESCDGMQWESSGTRLGVNIGGSFVGLINEPKRVGLAIGAINIGYKGSD